jgi:hypothetical protein
MSELNISTPFKKLAKVHYASTLHSITTSKTRLESSIQFSFLFIIKRTISCLLFGVTPILTTFDSTNNHKK